MVSSSGLRWAVLGTGRVSASFVPDILAATSTVTALWGRRPEVTAEFAASHDIPFWSTDLERVLERDDLDAVYIATPPAVHAVQAMQSLDAGKHVLIEKPMTTSAADTAALFRHAAARGLFAMEAMWMKFNPLHREVFHRIDGGLIAKPKFVRAGFGMPFPKGGSRWRASLGGSTVLDQGIYPITLATWALGAVTSATATGRVIDGVDASACITLQHQNGGVSQLACSITEFVDPSASISGTGGWIEIPAMFWSGERARLHAESTRALFSEPDILTRPREGNGYVPMIRSVTDTIRDGHLQHPDHDARATTDVAGIMDDARAQLLSRRP